MLDSVPHVPSSLYNSYSSFFFRYIVLQTSESLTYRKHHSISLSWLSPSSVLPHLLLPTLVTPKYDIKARGVDNDLAACEFYDVYLEARSNPSLDARDLESLNSREHAAVCIKLFFCFRDLKYTGCCRWAPPQTHDEHNVGEHESTSAAYESEHPPHFYD